MKFTTVALATVGLVVALALPAKADEWAYFYDDADCSVNGGEGVSITNPGCLGEAGRGSVWIPNYDTEAYCLVVTGSDGSCTCQSSGLNIIPTGYCQTLNTADQSYRFVGNQVCDANNC